SSPTAYEQLAALGEQLTYMVNRLLLVSFSVALVIFTGCGSGRAIKKARELLAQDRPEEAVRILDRAMPALQDARMLSNAYMTLGDALARLGRIGDAFSAYQRSMALDPDNIDVRQKTAEF